MIRYLRLYANCLRFSFAKALQFRLDFFFRVVMDCLFYAVQLAFFGVLYRHTGLLGGWDFDQVLVFVAGFFVVDALHMTFFSNNMWWFPILVNKGELDYYLVRPVSTLFFVGFREFAANSFLNLVVAAGILAWALGRYPGPLDPLAVVVFCLLLVNGALLYWILQMGSLIPVFWLHSNRGLVDAFWAASQLTGRPDRIFTGLARRLLLTLVPFSLIASLPAHVVFEGLGPEVLANVIGVTALAFAAMAWFFRMGLRAYSSASS